MTPRDFFDEVVHPNMMTAFEEADGIRSTVNAVLSLDALAGIIHAHGTAAGDPAMAAHETDDLYRDELARASRSFQVLRDAAASLKHGELSTKRKKARLVRSSKALRSIPNGLGLFRIGDEIGGEVIVIEFDPGPDYVRASSVIVNSYRMLKRIVEGGHPQTDEHDRGTFLGDAADDVVDVE